MHLYNMKKNLHMVEDKQLALTGVLAYSWSLPETECKL